MSERATTDAILKIPGDVYEAIRRHGERTYPHECCGVLLGRSGEDGNAVEAAVEAALTDPAEVLPPQAQTVEVSTASTPEPEPRE